MVIHALRIGMDIGHGYSREDTRISDIHMDVHVDSSKRG